MSTIRNFIRQSDLKYKWRILLCSVTALIVSLSNLFITRSTGSISDAATHNDTGEITRLLLVLTGLTAVRICSSGINTFLTQRSRGEFESTLRGKFAEYVLNVSLKVLSSQSSGQHLSIYSNDLPQAAALLSLDIFAFLGDLTLMIVAAVFMFLMEPGYTLIFLVMFPPLAYLQLMISRPISALSFEVSKRQGAFNSVVNDSLQNTTTIVAYGLEDIVEERYLTSYNAYFEGVKGLITKNLALIISGVMATNLPILFIYIVIALAVVRGEMTLGGFVAFTTIANSAGDWLSMLSQRLGSIQTKLASVTRLSENISAPLENELSWQSLLINLEESTSASEPRPLISLREVSFAYTPDIPVLQGINLNVLQGEKLAIVGSSGSGKSTLLKLMQTLLEADSGFLEYTEPYQVTPERSARVKSEMADAVSTSEDSAPDQFTQLSGPAYKVVRQMVSYVPQDSYLLPGSIGENLIPQLGEWDETKLTSLMQERLQLSCQQAGISGFIESLPEGFATQLNEGADNVSGGQRQRLAVARALAKAAPILLLDEATSALDSLSEEVVLQSILGDDSPLTVLFVSHRPSVLQACQRILVLDQGRLVEEGSFTELLAKGGIFASMYDSGQFNSGKIEVTSDV
ncbi:MAG: ABC transporter ATP-binding protein/permease [Symbiobacteriaceae bacterium]|nr:ABC transporter ATP-binding protein/permease [Symbiobacteriaceae bacterium]